MSIQEHLNKIRNAVYGHEVRESIAKGIETAYDDASENGNANMEVKVARGTHPNLRSRLEEVDNKQQQNTAQLQQKVGGTRKAEPEDLSATTLGMITGAGAPINLLSIPQRQSVTPITTTFFETGKNLFDPATVMLEHYVRAPDGNIAPSEPYSASDWIPVNPSTNYVQSHDYQLAFYDRDKTFISGKGSAAGLDFTTPENCYYIRTSVLTTNLNVFQLEQGTVPSAFEPHFSRIKQKHVPLIPSQSELEGLKWGIVGDSISTVGYKGGEYPEKIALRHSMTTQNLAIPGSLIAKSTKSSHETTHMCERVLLLDTDCDVVTVAGGTNDQRFGLPIGTFSDTSIETFYGAMHTLCKNMIARFPETPKAIFTPIKMRGKNTGLKNYVDVIKEVAAFYAIPVCDNFNEADLQPDIDTVNNAYFSDADGVHPNTRGHDILARKVENFLKNLV